ncbi:MAG: hypothetical protein ACT4OG_09725 [Alphaproteobacteria bacterium]
MTDVMRAEPAVSTGASFAPTAEAAAPVRAAGRKPGYFFGPWADFLMLGGGAVIILGLIAVLLPNGISPAQQGVMVVVLMTLINQPHFAHSYQIFYRNFREKAFGSLFPDSLRVRYLFAAVFVPAALTAFFAIAVMADDPKLLGYGVNLMFFLVGWHYVKQGYGILVVDSVQKRMPLSQDLKFILRLNGYASWFVSWLMINHAISQQISYLGMKYYTLALPTPAYQAVCLIAAFTTVLTLTGLWKQWRANGGKLPWIGVLSYLVTLYLWVIFVRIHPLFLAVVPTFHSLQYLAVVWRFQLNAEPGKAAPPARADWGGFLKTWTKTASGQLALFIALGIALGYLGFVAAPKYLDAVGTYNREIFGNYLFMFVFSIFINVHHYFLDNVMWRRENPQMKVLFSR